MKLKLAKLIRSGNSLKVKLFCLKSTNEVSEENLKISLKILLPESITQDKFRAGVLPLIIALSNFDIKKYKLILFIAEKANTQPDAKSFNHSYNDLRKELQLWI